MNSDKPKPRGVYLILLSFGIAVCLPTFNSWLSLREFDVDPLMFSFQAYWNLIGFVILFGPASLVILKLISDRRFSPWIHTLLVVAPALIWNLPGLATAAFTPLSARESFRERMGHSLPENANGLRAWYSHAAGETSYMFCFNTMPENTDSILASGEFRLVGSLSDPKLDASDSQQLTGGLHRPKDWPDPKEWERVKIYTSDKIKDHCEILTNESKTRIFVKVGDS